MIHQSNVADPSIHSYKLEETSNYHTLKAVASTSSSNPERIVSGPATLMKAWIVDRNTENEMMKPNQIECTIIMGIDT
jgi:hypothetical protein